MTAEFNITIPGAEIIKRLADLETQVRDLANERAVDKVLINTHTDKIAGLIDRVDRLTDFLNGKPVQTTVAPPYASTSRVERIAEDLADLKARLESTAKEVTASTGAVSVLITATDSLHDRIERLEDAAPNWPANDPEPPVDTLWHPFNFSVDLRPDDDKHVVIMTRDNVIAGPEKPSAYYWGNDGDGTIVAWRYAKAGE